MVLRQIPSKLLTMEQIGLPPSAKELLYKPRGLVLVTGPTGSGKTTTLASMINIINEERDEAHIITIEDPIEYYHKHKKAVVTQREINVDVPNFAEALRRRVLDGSGETDRAVRQAAAERAAGGPAVQIPYDDLARQIGECAARVTDEQVASVLRATGSEKAAFEVIAAAAVGAGLLRWRQGIKALEEATNAPK